MIIYCNLNETFDTKAYLRRNLLLEIFQTKDSLEYILNIIKYYYRVPIDTTTTFENQIIPKYFSSFLYPISTFVYPSTSPYSTLMIVKTDGFNGPLPFDVIPITYLIATNDLFTYVNEIFMFSPLNASILPGIYYRMPTIAQNLNTPLAPKYAENLFTPFFGVIYPTDDIYYGLMIVKTTEPMAVVPTDVQILSQTDVLIELQRIVNLEIAL